MCSQVIEKVCRKFIVEAAPPVKAKAEKGIHEKAGLLEKGLHDKAGLLHQKGNKGDHESEQPLPPSHHLYRRDAADEDDNGLLTFIIFDFIFHLNFLNISNLRQFALGISSNQKFGIFCYFQCLCFAIIT